MNIYIYIYIYIYKILQLTCTNYFTTFFQTINVLMDSYLDPHHLLFINNYLLH